MSSGKHWWWSGLGGGDDRESDLELAATGQESFFGFLEGMAIKKEVAARHNEGKPDLSYILDFPKTLVALARVCEAGAKKYDRDNWKKGGKPDAEYRASALRHQLKDATDGPLDPETNCLNLAHAIWNLAAMIENNR